MLQSLFIQNYALIRKLDIKFQPGFSIITGETGAGKSILLGALGLVLGQRADTSVLKDNSRKCLVEAGFLLKNYGLKLFFEQNDLDYEDITRIRREIVPTGKSRAFVNDTPVNLNVLKEISIRLIDIHSQHQNLNLGDYLFQLKVVDAFARHEKLLEEFKTEFFSLKKQQNEYNKLKADAENNKNELEFLQFQFDELERAKFQEGEQEKLEAEQNTLSHAGEIKNALWKASRLLNGDTGTSGLESLKEAVSNLQGISEYCQDADKLKQRIESCKIELKDIWSEIENKAENIEIDPGRLEFVNERLDLIYRLQQKHKVASLKELLEISNKLEEKLKVIANCDFHLEEMQKTIAQKQDKTEKLADKIASNRKHQIPQIENKVTELLIELGIPNASFSIIQKQLNEMNEQGNDEIVFLFSANKNTDLQDISQVASGGELSRLMLSIKYLISKSVALPTIIFDEVDTGVSGEIADKVGNIMKKMARNIQLINITHLPQIAAKGNEHFLVFKEDVDDATYTRIKLLSQDERLNEVAKMLSGSELTDAAMQNARELFNT